MGGLGAGRWALTVLPLAVMAVRNIPPFLLLAVPAASHLLGPEAQVHVRLPWRKQAEANAGADHPLINLGLVVTLAAAAAVLVAWSYRNRDPGLAGTRSTSARSPPCAPATARSTTITTKAAT